MKRFVFWTGIFNLTTGILFQFPPIARVFMPTENPGMVMHIFASMAMFLGVMLIFCSRDLAARGVLVMWEGILRMAGFAIMSGFALVGGAGPRAFSGIIDLIFGAAYLLLLPRFLGVSFKHLLLDKRKPELQSRQTNGASV